MYELGRDGEIHDLPFEEFLEDWQRRLAAAPETLVDLDVLVGQLCNEADKLDADALGVIDAFNGLGFGDDSVDGFNAAISMLGELRKSIVQLMTDIYDYRQTMAAYAVVRHPEEINREISQ